MHNFAGTVLELTGDLDGAAGHFQTALNLAERDSPETLAGITVNLAMIQLQRGEPQQALNLVDAHQPPPGAQQPVRYNHHAIRGEALLDLGDYAGAQRELGAALAIQDEARGRLRTYEDRMTWHAKELKTRQGAVLAAVLNLDWSAALDLVERSKARLPVTRSWPRAQRTWPACCGSSRRLANEGEPCPRSLSVKPFQHPAHWAPFILVGDWE